ncbi:GFA family protein [Agaribacterium haliotis]|uniref:GFA family protein n=1 Tax=Agaribacterium haliotis TaxID=2013869 RepID=UPI0019565DB7|nr:GFA family protein [Agaribacterium haliotis]
MVSGSCLCGELTYQVRLYADKIFNCHCRFCRKAHGADYVTLALADANTLTLVDHKKLLREHKNSLGGYRAFCACCGTRLMNYGPDKNKYLSIVVNTLDTALSHYPVAHCNTESKAPWCEPYEGIASFEAFPPLGK